MKTEYNCSYDEYFGNEWNTSFCNVLQIRNCWFPNLFLHCSYGDLRRTVRMHTGISKVLQGSMRIDIKVIIVKGIFRYYNLKLLNEVSGDMHLCSIKWKQPHSRNPYRYAINVQLPHSHTCVLLLPQTSQHTSYYLLI